MPNEMTGSVSSASGGPAGIPSIRMAVMPIQRCSIRQVSAMKGFSTGNRMRATAVGRLGPSEVEILYAFQKRGFPRPPNRSATPCAGLTLLDAARADRSRRAAAAEHRLAGLLGSLPLEIASTIRAVNGWPMQVPKRPLREPGCPAGDVLFVASGLLALYKPSGHGRTIVALRYPGELIYPRDAADAPGVQAIVASDLVVARRDDVDAACAANRPMREMLGRQAQRNQAILYEWLANCRRRDTAARVVHLLCEMAVRSGVCQPGEPLTNPLTQQQVGDITGQTSVNVNRVFAQLEGRGLIRRSGRRILVPDWDALRRWAGFRADYLA